MKFRYQRQMQVVPLIVMVQWALVSAANLLVAADAVDVVTLQQDALRESSGLAISRRRPSHFWTHNDSGGAPKLYAFNAQGRATGEVRIPVQSANDWEDMASFRDDGVPRLLVADCGDNDFNRSEIRLYLFDEPDPTLVTTAPPIHTISVTYNEGPRDCEAVAVDVERRQIILIGKRFIPLGGIYAIALPKRAKRTLHSQVTVTRLGTLAMPMVTAMDVDSSNGDVWITSYFQAFHFRCADRNMSIAKQLSSLPRPIELPRWKQIEALAVDEAQRVWVTSEGFPARLGRLPTRTAP